MTGAPVDITRTPVEELPPLRTVLGITFAPGAVMQTDDPESFARFDDVLARYPNVALSVVRGSFWFVNKM